MMAPTTVKKRGKATSKKVYIKEVPKWTLFHLFSLFAGQGPGRREHPHPNSHRRGQNDVFAHWESWRTGQPRARRRGQGQAQGHQGEYRQTLHGRLNSVMVRSKEVRRLQFTAFKQDLFQWKNVLWKIRTSLFAKIWLRKSRFGQSLTLFLDFSQVLLRDVVRPERIRE